MIVNLEKLSFEDRNLVEKEIGFLKHSICDKKLKKLEEELNLLAKFNLGVDAYIATIILFQIENGVASFDDFVFKNKEIEYIVKTICEVEQFNFSSYNDEANNVHKVFLSLIKNLMVVIIFLVKMLVKMRHLDELEEDSRKFLCTYAKEIYAPLASRLGFSDIKGEMEDICLKYFEPVVYKNLENLIKTHWAKTSLMLKELKIIIQNMLKDLNINGEIFSRQKHISSVYNKMQNKNVSIAEIYDFAALRVVVDDVEQCYNVLGKIHSLFKPISGRIKDYIANPKPNGYQSLHTTIIYSNEKPVEIQIRTKAMHEENEIGVSAHFLYKEKKNSKSLLDQRLLWVRTLMEKSKKSSALEFVETLKMDLYPGKIFVQTPKGKVVELPENSCVLDFAYAIHTALGNTCSGAKINGKFLPISTILKNNDNVEIITSSNVKGPSVDWLKIVKSNEARNKINAFFKSKTKTENIKIGKNMVDKYIQSKGYVLKDLIEKTNEEFLFKKFSVKDLDSVLAGVGYGSFKVEIVGNRLIANFDQKQPPKLKIETKPKAENNNKNSVIVANEKSFLIHFASCCKPVVGDEIIAYTTRGKGMSIHRKDCHNLKFLDDQRILPAQWTQNAINSEIQFKIVAIENFNAFAKISKVMADLKVEIVSLSYKTVSGKIEIISKVIIKNSADFEKIKKRIEMFNFVLNVIRI